MRKDSRIKDIILLPDPIPSDAAILAQCVRRTADLIGHHLLVPDLPEIHVHFTREVRRGGYRPETEASARHIALSIFGDTPHLTFAHEAGHYLDDALGKFEVYSTDESDRSGHPLRRVFLAVEQTGAVSALKQIEVSTRGELSEERFEALRLLQKPELWARAFAQYVAMRSGDSVMVAEVALRRSMTDEPHAEREYWATDDFADVAEAIDEAIEQLGWRL